MMIHTNLSNNIRTQTHTHIHTHIHKKQKNTHTHTHTQITYRVTRGNSVIGVIPWFFILTFFDNTFFRTENVFEEFFFAK